MFSGKNGHLSSTDAEFVDVIHTDGGVFGFPIALGDADFFPNGGFPAQPGCQINSLLQKSQIGRISKILRLIIFHPVVVKNKTNETDFNNHSVYYYPVMTL